MKTVQPTTKNAVCHVPRYGSKPPSPEVIEAARRLLAKEGSLLKEQDTIEPYSPSGEGIGNASDWNSMLITARSARGPQWDVASQQFFVDKGSHLYYDHSALVPSEAEQPVDQPTPQGGQTPNPNGFAMSPTPHNHTPTTGAFGEVSLGLAYPGSMHNSLTATPSPIPSRFEIPENRRAGSRSTRGNPGGIMY